MSCVAKDRWIFVSKAIKGKCLPSPPSSIRRFKSFDLIDFEAEEDELWWTCRLRGLDASISITLQEHNLGLDALTGFNNTGNIGIWPSEEVLAHYCVMNKHYFESKSVCEIGGGQTCFTGLAVAKSTRPAHILLTDGNEKCIQNIRSIINRNHFEGKSVHCRLLRWDETDTYADLSASFHCVLMADCLFFEDSHTSMMQMIQYILKPDGLAVIMAPSRGDSLLRFVKLAMARMWVSVFEKYDQLMWQRRLELSKNSPAFDHNLHYPILIILANKTNA